MSYVPRGLAALRIPFEDIVTATENFAEENLLKRGEIADVYKGLLLLSNVGINVVIRRFHPLSQLTQSALRREIETLSSLKHRNTISIVGFCDENDEKMIIMEHVVNGSLDKRLSDPNLTWSQRLHICVGASLALNYIHNDIECGHAGFHHDIKSSKILLDEDWEAKLFCFGFRVPYSVVFHYTTIYTDPVYARSGYGTHKSDVYSLGVILLEVLFGKEATIQDVNQFAAQMGKNHYEEGPLVHIIDPNLRKQMHQHSLSIFLETAYNCLKKQPEQRPHMNQIVETLQGALELQLTYDILVRDFAYLKIPLSRIKLATDDFANTYCIGSQRDYTMYKAQLDHSDSTSVLTIQGENKDELPKKRVIIKRIFNRYEKTIRDFFVEIKVISSYKHPNLVSLHGFCDECSEMILVFECDFEKTLYHYLRSTSKTTNLTWEQRIRICLDIARGLTYLNSMKHTPSMIHQGDISSTNVFIDEKLIAKIGNFELPKFDSQPSIVNTNNIDDTLQHIISSWEHGTQVDLESTLYKSMLQFEHETLAKVLAKAGEYSMPLAHRSWKELDKISSLGVVLFEVLVGRLAYDPNYMVKDVKGVASFARRQFNEGTLKNMSDPRIMEEVQEYTYTLRKGPDEDSLDIFSKMRYQFLAETPNGPPTLEVVIKSLEKALHFQVQNLEYLKIPLVDIHSATNSFDLSNRIGFGAYGEVYRGELKNLNIRSSLAIKMKSKDILTIAVKRIFSREDGQGKEGFFAEINVLSRCEHPNIISLLGFCVEGSELFLVYEHAPNGSLDDYLKSIDNRINFTWAQRLKMCLDIAFGLNYLHTTMEDKKRIIHRDIKSDNILLGKNNEAKIADFGFSKFHPANQQTSTIYSNNIAGTRLYMDPEYEQKGRLKKESDIYSFGVVLSEIFSGKLAYDSTYLNENEQGLGPIAQKHFEEGTLERILDPIIMDEAHELSSNLKVGPDRHSLVVFSEITKKCLAKSQAYRPTIEVVIKELNEALYIQENWKKTFKISLEHIKLGVDNFSHDKCIMRGGCGMLYKGEVQYNNRPEEVIVKRFSLDTYFSGINFSWEHGFLREFEVLFKHKQENIIGLVGYCKEMKEKIIVYERASKGSLNMYLNDTSLSWTKRLKICIDIAKGLKFLHGGDVGQDVVIHRDLKSSNILLTEDWKAKICGFEHSIAYPTNQEIEYVISDVVGSPGYCDPLYWETHTLTKESDIYAFGMILFEILCGRLACPEDFRVRNQFLDVLVKWHIQVARLDEIVFEGIKEKILLKSLATFRRIAIQCLHEEREERPVAGDVVVQLQKALEFQEAYEIWEAKLPRNYNDILQFSKSPEFYSTMEKKDIYDILSKGVLLKDDNLWFSIGDNGERNEMITAKMFSFRNRWSHRWRSIQESRFPKVAEMLDVSNLNIRIKIRSQLLPSDLKYSVHLVFKFCGPRKSHAQQMYVNLKYKIGGENLHAYFATWREDGWMMIELCQFSNQNTDTNFEVLLEGCSRCYCDSRAIYIEGIEFQAIDDVKQEKMVKLKEMQQVSESPGEMKRKVYHMEPVKGIVYDLSNVTLFNSRSSAQSRVEWIYKVPRRSVFCIKWYINDYQTVSPNIEFACYLVFKLSENCHGMQCPVIVRDLFHWKSKEIVYFRHPSP